MTTIIAISRRWRRSASGTPVLRARPFRNSWRSWMLSIFHIPRRSMLPFPRTSCAVIARQTCPSCYARLAASPNKAERLIQVHFRRRLMLTRTSKQLVSEANAVVESLSPEDAARLVGAPDVQFVDIREPAEVAKTGLVASAVHVPRGLLEFQVDPESPTHNAKLAASSR